MVQINNEKRQITITMPGEASELTAMQEAITTLIQRYNFAEFGQDSGDVFYSALELLAAITPNEEQQQRGLISEADYLELPKNLTPTQRKGIHEALYNIKYPEVKTGKPSNLVRKALEML